MLPLIKWLEPLTDTGYIRGHNILEVCRRTGLSRTVVYEAISDNGNPSLDTLCKIMTSFDKAA